MDANEKDYPANQPDLTNLLKLSGGNKALELKYIDNFLSSLPNQVANMQQALAASDGRLLAGTLHLIKPQLQFYGLTSAFECAKETESLLIQNPEITLPVKKHVEFILKEIIFACAGFQEIKKSSY